MQRPLLALSLLLLTALPAEAGVVPRPPSSPWKRKPVVQAPVTPDAPPAPADTGEEIDLEALFDTEVEVATKRAQSLVEAPAVVSVITADDIRERGYMSVAEALRAIPGFYVVDDYLMPSVGVRGLASGQRSWSRIVKLMVDGHPVAYRPDATNFLGPELIPIDAVKRVEVIRGPGSALYGADAFLGVVNVITKRGEDVAGGRIDAGAGLFQATPQYQGSLLAGAPFGDAEGVIAGAGGLFDRPGLFVPQASALTDRWNGQESRDDRSKPGTLFGRIGSLATPLGAVSVDGLYQRLDSGGEFQDWRPFTHQNRIQLENKMVRAALRSAPTARIGTTATIAYTRGNPGPDDRIGVGNPQYLYKREQATDALDATLEGSYALNARDSVTVGADVSRNVHQLPTYLYDFQEGSARAGEQAPAGEPGGTQEFTNVGAYGQGVLHVLEDTSVTMGLRLDAHNVYGPVFNGRAGVVHLLAPGVVGKVLYGSSFKAPSPQQLFGRPLIFGDIFGNAALRPEKAQTAEAALSWIPGRALEVLGDVYYTHVSDKIGFVAQGGNSKAVNLAESDSVGLETELRWRWQALHGMLNLSLQQTAALVAEDQTDEALTQPEAYPLFMANAGVGAPLWDLPLGAFVEARLVGTVPSTQSNFVANGRNAYELPATALLDATLASREWTLGEQAINAQLKVSNFLDSEYVMPGFGGVDYPGRGRTVWMRVGYAW